MKLIPESSAFDAINTALNFDTVDGCVIGRLESYSCKLVGQEKALYKKFSNSEEAGIHDLQALSPPRYSASATVAESAAVAASPHSISLLHRSQSSGGSTTSSSRGGGITFTRGDISPRNTTHSSSGSEGDTSLLNTSTSSSSVTTTTSTTQHQFSDGDADAGFVDAAQEEDKIVRKTLFYLVSTLNAAFHPDYDFSGTSSREFSMEHSLQHVMRSVERQLHVMSPSQLLPVTEQLWTAIDEAVCLPECEIYTYNPDENSDPYSDDGCLWSFNYFFYNRRLKRIVFFTCRLVSSLSSNQSDFFMDSDVDFDE